MAELTPSSDIPKYKLIFLGDQGTGKSSILNRFVDDKFIPTYQATIGLDFQSKNIQIDNQDIHLLLYDTAGQEKFRSLIPMYTREANIIILVYDITRKDSFLHIPSWINELSNVKIEDIIFALVGNKIDLNEQREVSINEGEKFAEENNFIFEEVSAKTGENFEELFRDKIYESIYRKYKNEFEKRNYLNGDELVVNLDDEENKNKIKIDKNNFKKKSTKKSFCC
jgi:Ras-related protein Rab-6A